MWIGQFGSAMIVTCLVATFLTMGAYIASLYVKKREKTFIVLGRSFYSLTAIAMLAAFGALIAIVHAKTVGGVYRYDYAWGHTSNDLQGFYRWAATWSGQEGSFLLWGFWTAIIGFLVFAKAGKYEARVMPIFVTVLGFLAAILIKQTPFGLVPGLTDGQLAANPELLRYPPEGQGLNPQLQNYWMTIHPPTIFFGFASLLVPYSYAIAALIWKDYDNWAPRVMPYALLTSLTLGIGLFMGGYWAYETQGWHGFWAWDPVENASLFPWLAVTALMHGLVVQRDRGGMVRTNIFLGIFGFWLFLVGTFLTRSGALAGKTEGGQLLSVHAFANIGSTGLALMTAMVIAYGAVGLLLLIFRTRFIPSRKVLGDTLLSRDFAFFVAVLMMVVACGIVTLATTRPLFLSWMNKPPDVLKQAFYNRSLFPFALIMGLFMGVVPWLAWRKTNPDAFMKRMLVPWFAMLIFGFSMLFWVLYQQGEMTKYALAEDPNWIQKQEAWINPTVQRLAVMGLASLGFLAALSNTMLAYKVFMSRKPLTAGGWVAHVGVGLLMIGAVTSNTFERSKPVMLKEGGEPIEAFGYTFEFERITGKPHEVYPSNPDFDKNNAVEIRVTPPKEERDSKSATESKTYLITPEWFAYNLHTARGENKIERIRWPHIQKYFGHDLYVGFFNDPGLEFPYVELKKGEVKPLGPYTIMLTNTSVKAGKEISAEILIKTPDDKVVRANPFIQMSQETDDAGKVIVDQETKQPIVNISNRNVAIPEIRDDKNNPGSVYVGSIDPKTGVAKLLFNLPQAKANWAVPMLITYKPWINVVWMGVIIMGLGTLIALTRRALEARKVSDYVKERGLADGDDPWSASDAKAAAQPNSNQPVKPQARKGSVPKPQPSNFKTS